MPSCWHGKFPAEICLFNVVQLLMPITKSSAPVKQGGDTTVLFLSTRTLFKNERLNGESYLLLREGYRKKEVIQFRKTGIKPTRNPSDIQRDAAEEKYPYPNFFTDVVPYCGWAAQNIKWPENEHKNLKIYVKYNEF